MKKFGVGMIGCGAIFGVHAYPLHLRTDAEVRVVCDIKKSARETAAHLLQCDAYSDYRELLQRDDIDVVHILTPHYLHAQMAIDAANAGKHVLTEKPMAIKMDDARKMIEVAKRNNVTLGVIMQNRYNSASVAVKKAISDGSLGKIIGQRVVLSWHKPADYYKNSDWHGTWDKEGGSLMIDQAIHVMDLARWFVGDEITSIEATIANRNHPDTETEDTAEGLISYGNGVKSIFFATNNYSFNSPVVVETHCENGTALVEFDKAVITYQNGRELVVVNDPTVTINEAYFEALLNESMKKYTMRSLKEWGVVIPATWKSPRTYWGVSHKQQIDNFYDSLSANAQPDITGEVAIKTLEMILAIYDSSRQQCPIALA